MMKYLAIACGENKSVGVIYPYDFLMIGEKERILQIKALASEGKCEILNDAPSLCGAKKAIAHLSGLEEVLEKLSE